MIVCPECAGPAIGRQPRSSTPVRLPRSSTPFDYFDRPPRFTSGPRLPPVFDSLRRGIRALFYEPMECEQRGDLANQMDETDQESSMAKLWKLEL